MDYEKKYKNALTIAQSRFKIEKDESVLTCLGMMFPELRESEDERIIRAIIDALYSHTNSINLLSSRGYQMENIEAWLEKQKYDRMKPVYDNQDSFESALEKAWKEYNDSGARTVDGCEDNYVECAHAKGFREGYLFGLEKQKELTPADGWDYADKRMSHPLYLEGFEAGRAVEREVSEQEWSEEDEKKLGAIITDIETRSDLTESVKIKYVSFLKSLRPSWKPSEEQMEALLWCVAHLGGADRRVLAELYEHLKKL